MRIVCGAATAVDEPGEAAADGADSAEPAAAATADDVTEAA